MVSFLNIYFNVRIRNIIRYSISLISFNILAIFSQVIDLLVKILQCPLDGAIDEMNLIQVFKEAYEILYTYMIGKSRKNALYFAKYIEFFQTQFTQKVFVFFSDLIFFFNFHMPLIIIIISFA